MGRSEGVNQFADYLLLEIDGSSNVGQVLTLIDNNPSAPEKRAFIVEALESICDIMTGRAVTDDLDDTNSIYVGILDSLGGAFGIGMMTIQTSGVMTKEEFFKGLVWDHYNEFAKINPNGHQINHMV